MKKLLLVAAIGVAGIMSANTIAVDSNNIEYAAQNIETNTKIYDCLLIQYDCGSMGIACVNNMAEIIEMAWNGYDFMCND